MKTLYIIRHAKSSWKFELGDKDRPLSLRGRRDVLKTAKYLSKNEETPDLMITSHASRALYTALFIADEWGYPEDDLVINENLYQVSSDEILSELSQIKEAKSVAVFGHNPGFTQLVNKFSKEYIDNLPTCGVYTVELDIDEWSEVMTAEFTRKFYISPKRIPGK